ncbi:hypothetical protein RHGRI_032872 [Rhododendron griersonianum]|uniref:Nucleoside phosphorylase domain-containing protein n=1 Tax=Rhododendron griersonianum TaxID=479676 RepID=A0AAV6IDM3_9ERIC|nr:hypothetical protein RHGRI_032872 [Rhododendron griersonianum]
MEKITMVSETKKHPISTILIVVAMQTEALPIVNQLQLKEDLNSMFPKGVPWVRYHGTYKELDISIVWPGKDTVLGVDSVGTIPASLVTYVSLQALQPDLVINAGTAGGFKAKGATVGDTFLVSHVAFRDRRIPIPVFDLYGIGLRQAFSTPNLLRTLNLKVKWMTLPTETFIVDVLVVVRRSMVSRRLLILGYPICVSRHFNMGAIRPVAWSLWLEWTLAGSSGSSARLIGSSSYISCGPLVVHLFRFCFKFSADLVGNLSTSDSFEAPQEKASISENDATLEDMEWKLERQVTDYSSFYLFKKGAAVAYVADVLKVPAVFIKAVTNIVDGDKPTIVEFRQNLAVVTAALGLAVAEVVDFINGKCLSEL